MSAGYASRLKSYPNKGVCGLPEITETARAYKLKVDQLASMLKQSKHTVVLTGAGISTAAGIPDFRGPRGIWTLEENKKKQQQRQNRKRTRVTANDEIKKESMAESADESAACCAMDFAAAKPTFTHRTITRLASHGIVQFIVTQNVDGLHRRSGLSRDKHSILHGCAFTEKCEDCDTEHFRDTDVGGMSFQKT